METDKKTHCKLPFDELQEHLEVLAMLSQESEIKVIPIPNSQLKRVFKEKTLHGQLVSIWKICVTQWDEDFSEEITEMFFPTHLLQTRQTGQGSGDIL
ncbi:protein FAM114A2-like [Dipodomys merriami]|uniref:protein FAM114A2-like n=1 Tax=Dipodomys merriami TaxID=94247 RepID=UPI003855C66E